MVERCISFWEALFSAEYVSFMEGNNPAFHWSKDGVFLWFNPKVGREW